MGDTSTFYRTHTCGELRMEQVGETVTLAGWMENIREVSGNLAFLVLRDFYGTTQVVLETEEMIQTAKELNKETVISVTGAVRERDSKNPKLPTGDIEVVPAKIEVLGRCRHNELPFPVTRSQGCLRILGIVQSAHRYLLILPNGSRIFAFFPAIFFLRL